MIYAMLLFSLRITQKKENCANNTNMTMSANCVVSDE